MHMYVCMYVRCVYILYMCVRPRTTCRQYLLRTFLAFMSGVVVVVEKLSHQLIAACVYMYDFEVNSRPPWSQMC